MNLNISKLLDTIRVGDTINDNERGLWGHMRSTAYRAQTLDKELNHRKLNGRALSDLRPTVEVEREYKICCANVMVYLYQLTNEVKNAYENLEEFAALHPLSKTDEAVPA